MTTNNYFKNVTTNREGIDEIDIASLSNQPTHTLIDVRGFEEYYGELGHIDGSQLVPLPNLGEVAGAWDRSEPLVVMCRSGQRSLRAVRMLRTLGFHRVVNLKGGITAYHQQDATKGIRLGA